MSKDINNEELISKYSPNLRFNTLKIFHFYPFIVDLQRSTDNFLDELVKSKFFINGLNKSRLGWLPTLITNTQFSEVYSKFSKEQILTSKIKNKKIKENNLFYSKENLFKISCDGENKFLPCQFSRFVRIRSNGTGILTICIEVDAQKLGRNITFSDIEIILRLTPRTWVHLLSNKISELENQTYYSFFKSNGKTYSLWDIYKDSMAIVKSELQSINCSLIEDNEGIYPLVNKIDNNVHKIPDTTDTINNISNSGNYQVPYILYIGEIPSKLYDTIFLEDNVRNDIQETYHRYISKEIAAFIYKLFVLEPHYRFLNMEYIRNDLELLNRHITSMNMNSMVFSFFHRMSSILFCKDCSTIPANFLIPSVLDIIELTRMRWHSFVIVNLLIDKEINILYSKTLNDDLLKIIKSKLDRFRIISSLNMSDSSTILHDGHIGFDLRNLVCNKMGIHQLEDDIIRKLQLMEKIYYDSLRENIFNSDHDTEDISKKDISFDEWDKKEFGPK